MLMNNGCIITEKATLTPILSPHKVPVFASLPSIKQDKIVE